MLEASKIARDFSVSKKIETSTVEVLEWIGAAYGRQRSGDQDAQSTTAEAPTSKHMAANARAALFLNYLNTTAPSLSAPSRQVFAAFVVLLGTVCGAAFQHMWGTEHLRTTIEPMTETYLDASYAVHHSEVLETTEKPALADIEHEVQEAKSRLAGESQARISAETKAAQLATALAAETLVRENAERAEGEDRRLENQAGLLPAVEKKRRRDYAGASSRTWGRVGAIIGCLRRSA